MKAFAFLIFLWSGTGFLVYQNKISQWWFILTALLSFCIRERKVT